MIYTLATESARNAYHEAALRAVKAHRKNKDTGWRTASLENVDFLFYDPTKNVCGVMLKGSRYEIRLSEAG